MGAARSEWVFGLSLIRVGRAVLGSGPGLPQCVLSHAP